MRWFVCGIVFIVGCFTFVAEPSVPNGGIAAVDESAEVSPLPLETSLPAIDHTPLTAGQLRELEQIRQQQPSHLRSSLTASPAGFQAALKNVSGQEQIETEASPAHVSTDFATTLRTAARHLDRLAADREDEQQFIDADQIREIAQRLRIEGRRLEAAQRVE